MRLMSLTIPLLLLLTGMVQPVHAEDRPPELPSSKVKIVRNFAYGDHDRQRMDIYAPRSAKNAPVIFMVHGGGWAFGSKSGAGVVDNKVAHWLPRGYIFVSVEYRLLPEADPWMQAQDVAAALAAAQSKVGELGGDPDRFILMGHSAGGHLIALLAADPALAKAAGTRPWLAAVALDTAAYDIETTMRNAPPQLYTDAFGTDPGFWQRTSPLAQLKQAAPPFLLVCSTLRRNACSGAEAFAEKARSTGGQAEVLPVDMRHAPINRQLGMDSAYTEAVDRFLNSVTD